jgi:DNA-binding NtrC family response regulator
METKENRLIFIVDDNLTYAKMLGTFISAEIGGMEIRIFGTGESFLHEMHLNPFAIVLDYFLDTKFENAWNGVQVLKKILSDYPTSSVIMISAQESMELALSCMNEGAVDYVIKNDKTLPAIQKILLNLIDDAVEY